MSKKQSRGAADRHEQRLDGSSGGREGVDVTAVFDTEGHQAG